MVENSEIASRTESTPQQMSEKIQNFWAEQMPQLKGLSEKTLRTLKKTASGAILVAGLTLAAACAEGNTAYAATPTVTPTETVTPTLTPEPTIQSSSEISQTETATDTVETQQTPDLSVSGYLSEVPGQPNLEQIKMNFPENLIGGEEALLPDNEPFSVYFTMESDLPINSVQIDLASLVGKELGGDKLITLDTANGDTAIGQDITVQLSVPEGTRLLGETLPTISESVGVVGKNIDGVTHIRVYLPNETLKISTPEGEVEFNPGEAFLESGTLTIDRKSSFKDVTAFPDMPITIKDMTVDLADEELTLNVTDFVVTEPQVVSVGGKTSSQPESSRVTHVQAPETPTPQTTVTESSVITDTEQTPEPTTEPTPTVRKIVVQSGVSTNEPTSNSNQESATSPTENDWTKEWEANETVPLQEWWNDMINKKYIFIDDVVRNYAPEDMARLDDLIRTADLVPNSQEFYNAVPGSQFITNCSTLLEGLEEAGQGYIKINRKAYENIPGGSDCQIFVLPNK